MDIAAAVIVGAAGLAVLADRAFAWSVRWRLTRPRPAVLVVTRDGATFRGTLWRRHAGIVELRGAELMTDEGPTSVEGALILDASAVSWIQVAPNLEV